MVGLNLQKTEDMKTPSRMHSHFLAHGTMLTPDILRDCLEADQKLGFEAMVIVAALIDQSRYSPGIIADVFEEVGMSGLVCGLNQGDGPDPLGGDEKLVIESLRAQAAYAIALAERDCGPELFVGPTHAKHRTQRPVWPDSAFDRWIDAVEGLANETGLRVLFEPLNGIEDGTPTPFSTIHTAVCGRKKLGIHFDTGHARAHGLTPKDLPMIADSIGYFEFANVGRHPLYNQMGIDFAAYARSMQYLPEDCEVGDEPFDPSVINAFGLQKLCTTTMSGSECLKRDVAYLRSLGVMA